MKKINIYKSVENLNSVYIEAGLTNEVYLYIDPRIGTLPNKLIELYILKYYFNPIRNIIETQSKRIKVE